MALENVYSEAKPAVHAAEKAATGLKTLTEVGWMADKIGATSLFVAGTKVASSVSSATSWIPGASLVFGSAPSVARTTASGVIEAASGLAPLLAGAEEGVRVVGNVSNGQFGKAAINITKGAAKIATIAFLPLGLVGGLAAEFGSRIITGKGMLEHVGNAVEGVLGSGEVVAKAESKGISATVAGVSVKAPPALAKAPEPTVWQDRIRAERGQAQVQQAAAAPGLAPDEASHFAGGVERARQFAASQPSTAAI